MSDAQLCIIWKPGTPADDQGVWISGRRVGGPRLAAAVAGTMVVVFAVGVIVLADLILTPIARVLVP